MAGVDINRTTSGISLPASVSNEIWSDTIEGSVVMSASRQIELPGSGVTIHEITGEPVASWVAETAEKPVSRPTLANKTITPYKLAVIVPFSNEFRRDLSGLYGALANRLPGALAKKFDDTVFAASGAPGGNFDQLGTGTTDEDVDTAAIYESLADAYSAAGDPSHWVVNASLRGLLLRATDGFGRPLFTPEATTTNTVGQMLGLPILRTKSTITGADGIVGDFAGNAVYGTVEGVQVSISDQATLTDGEDTINLWQQNMFAVRAEIEVGFRVRSKAAFKRLSIVDAS